MAQGTETILKKAAEPAVTDNRNEQLRTMCMGVDRQEGQENLSAEMSTDLKYRKMTSLDGGGRAVQV